MRIETIKARFEKDGYILTSHPDGSWTATKKSEKVTAINLNQLFKEVYR